MVLMPRRRPRDDREEPEPLDPARLLGGWRRTVVKRDGEWNVQPMTAAAALKSYVCPGCGLEIVPGASHVVAWRADGILGEQRDLEARRHWHNRCWEIKA